MVKYLREDNEGIDSALRICGTFVERCLDLDAESIAIPEGIEYIESDAFAECRKLKHIEFPNSLWAIFNNAFEDCYSLEEVTIPASVGSINAAAFMNCIRLRKVNILSDKTRIAFSAFYGIGNDVVISCDGFDFTMNDLPRAFPQDDWECDMHENDGLWFGYFYVGDTIRRIKKYRKQDEDDITAGRKTDAMIEDENDWGF